MVVGDAKKPRMEGTRQRPAVTIDYQWATENVIAPKSDLFAATAPQLSVMYEALTVVPERRCLGQTQ